MKLIDLINAADAVDMIVNDVTFGWTVRGDELGLEKMLAKRWPDATVRSFDIQGSEMVINVEEEE